MRAKIVTSVVLSVAVVSASSSLRAHEGQLSDSPTLDASNGATQTELEASVAEVGLEPINLPAGESAALDANADPAQAAKTSPAPMESTKYGPSGGESLFSVGFQFINTTSQPEDGSSTNDSNIFGALGFGYFLADEHEIGIQAFGLITIPDEGDEFVVLDLAPYYNFNFRSDARTWFYIGPNAGVSYAEMGGESDSSFSFGAHAGIRHWIAPRVSIFVEPRYTYSQLEFAGFETDEHQFAILVGLNVSF